MRIGIVGGLDRNAAALQAVASRCGHQIELHNGVIASAAAAAGLKALVARSEMVLILTDVNSHNAVHVARREARARSRTLRIMRTLGVSRFASLLHNLDGSSGSGAAS